MECSIVPKTQHDSSAFQVSGVGILGGIHIGDGIGEGAIVAQAAGEYERDIVGDALVENAGFETPLFDGAADAAAVVHRIDGAHVIAVAVLFLAPVRHADSKRRAKQSGLHVVNTERVTAQ